MFHGEERSLNNIYSCSVVSTDRNVKLSKRNFSSVISFKLFATLVIVTIYKLGILYLIAFTCDSYYRYKLLSGDWKLEYDISIKNISIFSEVVNKSIPVLWKHPLVSNINCNALLNGNVDYIREESKEFKKIESLQDTFSTLCEDIKKRGHYPDKPLSREEADFPIAYIRTIYKVFLSYSNFKFKSFRIILH